MCINPSFIWVLRGSFWTKQDIACRQCWRCLGNVINGYVGRSLCEASTSDWSLALTLTYRPGVGDLADKVLTPEHFQTFIRTLRNSKHKIRYLAAGEYGSLRGRAHFHTILFGMGQPLQIPLKTNFIFDAWPYGHVFADGDGSERSIRYVCKYILKDKDAVADNWFSISKKPSLGAAFFKARAQEYVRHGVFPSSFNYLPPGGEPGRAYFMTGATRRDFLLELLKGAREKYPVDSRTLNEWVLKAVDKVDRWNAANLADISDDEALAEMLLGQQQRKLDNLIRRGIVGEVSERQRMALADLREAYLRAKAKRYG